MKISMKNFRWLGIILVALVLIANSFILSFPASAQTSIENDFLTILNAERASLGKGPLTFNTSLTSAAYLHSKDMAENGYFSHTSKDGRTFAQRINDAGYTNYYAAGENIAYAYGAPDAAKVYGMWKNSPGHYTNMMGNYNEAGLGVYSLNGYTYYTLDLGRSKNPAPAPTPTADFSCSISPNTLYIKAGSSAAATITATSLNGFTGTVGLTAAPLPSGWTVTFNPVSLAIGAGAAQLATLSITTPATTPAGAYVIVVTGTSGAKNHTAALTVNVQNTPTPTPTIKNLNVAVRTNSPTYAKSAYGTITVTITDSATGAGLSGASVAVKIYRPDGALAGTVYRTSGTNGNLLVYFSISSSAQSGGYTIVSTASRTGYQSGTGQATFTVN
jgi:hypothetical protein